jgi:RNA polymerase sigma factor (TIGR02999 family)
VVSADDLLARLRDGDNQAAEELFPRVYRQLRALAGGYLRGRAGHTLSPTALVHEAFLKLVKHADGYRDHAHFVAVAATAMRQILINHARDAVAKKRGGKGRERVTLSGLAEDDRDAVDALAVDELLRELETLDPRQAKLVELRVFGGLTEDEIATVLEVSVRTVQKDWRRVKAWILERLGHRP